MQLISVTLYGKMSESALLSCNNVFLYVVTDFFNSKSIWLRCDMYVGKVTH